MEAKLLDALAVLLGPQARRAGQALLRQLTVATVRAAFRRLALRTHPDRVAGAGAMFIEATRAYELLMTFLLARRPVSPGQEAKRPSDAQRPASSKSAKARPGAGRDIFYHGPLPRRRLRLAEFLYYSGYISWQSLISALVWQRSGRPRFGEIARQLRMVSDSDMTRVLSARGKHEQTGAAATRLRLLNIDDVRRILRIQRARQRPIGRYFVEKGRMSEDDLIRILRELYRHNIRTLLSKNRVETGKATA